MAFASRLFGGPSCERHPSHRCRCSSLAAAKSWWTAPPPGAEAPEGHRGTKRSRPSAPHSAIGWRVTDASRPPGRVKSGVPRSPSGRAPASTSIWTRTGAARARASAARRSPAAGGREHACVPSRRGPPSRGAALVLGAVTARRRRRRRARGLGRRTRAASRRRTSCACRTRSSSRDRGYRRRKRR